MRQPTDGRVRAERRGCAASSGCPATSRSATGALMLAALADGESRIARRRRRRRRPLDGRRSSRALGATVERGRATTAGRSTTGSSRRAPTACAEPDGVLDCGNSGTSLRLFSGILAGLPMTATLDGDDSLRRRPVARIIEPLRSMGAALHGRARRLPPAADRGRSHPAPGDRLRDAGAERPGEVGDPAGGTSGRRAGRRSASRSRRATTRSGCCERGACRSSGRRRPTGAVAWTVDGGVAVRAIDERVPGDVSAAAFWLVAGADPSRRRADASATSASTRRGARSSTSCGRWAPTSTSGRDDRTVGPTTASASRWPT